MKCRLHYVLITYLCRSKYTPHTHPHTLSHTHTRSEAGTHHIYAAEPSNALHTLRRPSGKISQAHVQLPSFFLSLCLSLSLSLPGNCLPSFLALCSRISVFSLLFDAFPLSTHFGLPAIDLHSVNMHLGCQEGSPPHPRHTHYLHLSRTNSISSQLTV